MFTSIDDQLSQKELDEITLKECEDANGIGCQIRFRTLKNKKYNRYANTIMVKKHFLCWEMRLNQKNL